MNEESKHGGFRPGSGRPREHGPREMIAARVVPALAARFRLLRAARRMSSEELLTWLVELGEANRPKGSPEGSQDVNV